jgi:enterochelin esterase-like enzyme
MSYSIQVFFFVSPKNNLHLDKASIFATDNFFMKSKFFQVLKPSTLLRNIRGDKYISEMVSNYSPKLNRTVRLEVFRPKNLTVSYSYPLLILNDGQDGEALQLRQTLDILWQRHEIEPMLVVGVFAGDRMQEYGVASEKDYAGRGSRAAAYTNFVIEELVPFIQSQYRVDKNKMAIAGFSLGALSAFDIAWRHPEIFSKVGAFSGSFWWRNLDAGDKAFDEKKNRITHNLVQKSKSIKPLKFWFQTGTKDEPFDRNGNGVIDSIDDTLDLISELTQKGYRPFHDIVYYEIKGGEHNQHTWSKAMPNFLKWAFPSAG